MKYLVLLLLAATATAYPQSPDGHVIGGVEATVGQFPYIVSLHLFDSVGHNCGGSIYNEEWIITAAHCIEPYHVSNYTIIAGEHDFLVDDGFEQYRDVELMVYHQAYDSENILNDVGLIKVTEPFVFNERVQPIALTNRDERYSGMSTLAGWGSLGGILNLEYPTIPHTVDLPIVTDEECGQVMTPGGTLPEENICGGAVDQSIGACFADSGGPLVGEGENGLSLVGIVSWGSLLCSADSIYSVFAETAYYVDWFLDTMANN